MATWHLGDHEGDVGKNAPGTGTFTVLKANTDPADEHGVGDRGFNDLRYAGIGGGAKADALHVDVKEANSSAIKKGQVCAISGSSGTKFEIKLCDCDDPDLIRLLGIAQADISQNGGGVVVYKGILTSIDTTSADLNPNTETWAAGDLLWVASTPGGLTNVRPTSGRCIKAARTLKGNSASDSLIAISHCNAIVSGAAAGEDIILRPGDSAGVNKVIIKNYANVEKMAFFTNGNLTLSGTVDGRDIDTDGTKLDTIDNGATKYPDTGEQAFLDADHTKLDGIEAGADVTDPLAIINSIVCNNGNVIVCSGNVISN